MDIDKKGETGINNSDISSLTLEQATDKRDQAKNALLEFERDNRHLRNALEKEELNQKIQAIHDFFTAWEKLPHSNKVDELWVTIDAKNTTYRDDFLTDYRVEVGRLLKRITLLGNKPSIEDQLAEAKDDAAYNFLRDNIQALINNVAFVRAEILPSNREGAISQNRTVKDILGQLGSESKDYQKQELIDLEEGNLKNYYLRKAGLDAAQAQVDQFGKK